MVKRFSLFAVFLGLIIINACSEGKLYKNNKEHVKLGQTFVGKFYKEVSKNKFEKGIEKREDKAECWGRFAQELRSVEYCLTPCADTAALVVMAMPASVMNPTSAATLKG